MRVARLHGAGDLRIHDEPKPTPGQGEVLVRVEAVGLCGSDLHWFEDGGIGGTTISRPIVLGHEFAGHTEDAGWSRSTRGLLRPLPALPRGDPNLCPSVRFAGHGPVDGALREWIAWPAECLVPCRKASAQRTPRCSSRSGRDPRRRPRPRPHRRRSRRLRLRPIGLFCLQVARAAGAARLFATDLARAATGSKPRRLGAAVFPADNAREAAAIHRASAASGSTSRSSAPAPRRRSTPRSRRRGPARASCSPASRPRNARRSAPRSRGARA